MLERKAVADIGEADSHIFGTLLKYFRNRVHLTQEDLAYRVGKQSRASIVAWENSLYLPRERDVVLDLSRVLRLSEQETDRLLLAGHFLPAFQTRPAGAEQEGEEIAQTRVLDVALPPHIPDEPYYTLPGREEDMAVFLSAFQDQQGPSTLVVDGLGGIGKTAFAVELARRAQRRQIFEKVVGESARQEHFIDGEIVRVSEATMSFESLLDALARQLDHWEIPALASQEKRSTLARMLRQHRYLVLVDNLEAVADAQKIVAELQGFLRGSRALITSREKVPHDFVRSLSLRSLPLEDALVFVRKDLQQRARGHPLGQASRETLSELWEASGGAPLAMKLIVAQTQYLDVEIVLRRLKQARSELYSFIFRQSWQLLSLPAQLILIYIGRTVPDTVSWEELAEVQEITHNEEELLVALHQLVHSSLLDVYALPGQVRYGIHQLTRQFVQADLPVLWQERARE
jgi:DNA-binding XRE family transcriptional regulator